MSSDLELGTWGFHEALCPTLWVEEQPYPRVEGHFWKFSSLLPQTGLPGLKQEVESVPSLAVWEGGCCYRVFWGVSVPWEITKHECCLPFSASRPRLWPITYTQRTKFKMPPFGSEVSLRADPVFMVSDSFCFTNSFISGHLMCFSSTHFDRTCRNLSSLVISVLKSPFQTEPSIGLPLRSPREKQSSQESSSAQVCRCFLKRIVSTLVPGAKIGPGFVPQSS